jgi:hypothetical protein
LLNELVEVVIGEHPPRPLLAATDIDVFQFAVPNECRHLLDAGLEPFRSFLRRPQNAHTPLAGGASAASRLRPNPSGKGGKPEPL